MDSHRPDEWAVEEASRWNAPGQDVTANLPTGVICGLCNDYIFHPPLFSLWHSPYVGLRAPRVKGILLFTQESQMMYCCVVAA